MARIAGVNIPTNKHVGIALTHIFGIGRNRAVMTCKAAGVEPVKLFPDEANGRFAHIMDPEGRKIELWQPKPMS